MKYKIVKDFWEWVKELESKTVLKEIPVNDQQLIMFCNKLKYIEPYLIEHGKKLNYNNFAQLIEIKLWKDPENMRIVTIDYVKDLVHNEFIDVI